MAEVEVSEGFSANGLVRDRFQERVRRRVHLRLATRLEDHMDGEDAHRKATELVAEIGDGRLLEWFWQYGLPLLIEKLLVLLLD